MAGPSSERDGSSGGVGGKLLHLIPPAPEQAGEKFFNVTRSDTLLFQDAAFSTWNFNLML
jgi:hypothetical protein